MLTEERRKDLVKVVRNLAEDGKVGVRHARSEALSQVKKVEHVSDDDKHRTEGEIQKLHDDFIKQIGEIVTAKEEEIMEV
jgi:ribosome recycling factor